MTTFDEHIRSEFESAFGEADPALIENPRIAFEIFRSGHALGLKEGQEIKADVDALVREVLIDRTRKLGYAQGLTNGAYLASHTSTAGITAAMTPAQAAIAMRESIVAAINLAAGAARIAAEA